MFPILHTTNVTKETLAITANLTGWIRFCIENAKLSEK
jgi:hypothetical protein